MPTKIKPKLSIGNQTEAEWNAHKEKVMSPEEMESLNFYISRAISAREQRESTSRFFDDLNYTDDYITNENAKNTYLREKLNDSEVRVNTGVTEKKIEVVINEILSLNLQHEVRAFDRNDNLLMDLGEDFTDIVTRTNIIEKDDDVWEQAVIELLTQRAVFMTEVIEEKKTRNKTRTVRIIKKEMEQGLNIFLGDITIPAHKFQEQPYIIKYKRLHWRTAQQLWGTNPNWQHVLAGVRDDFNLRTGAYAWRFGLLDQYQVEIVEYISVPDGERQVIINGVMMFKPGTNETKIPWLHPGYNTTMTGLKSMSNLWAYCKHLVASAKTLQGLSNESIRLMIRKWQQALEPPMAVVGNKVFSRDIWDPGSQAQGLKKGDFQKLIDHDGVTPGEFNMMEFIEQKTEEFIGGGDLSQGLSDKERTTATGDLLRQRNAIKQLGLAVGAVMRLKRDMTELRIYSVLEEHLKPNGKKLDPITKKVVDTFSGFTAEGVKLDNQKVGTKRIQFSDRDLTGEEKQEVFNEEKKKAKRGINFRFRNINVKKLLNLFVNWFVVVHPQQKEGSALDKFMFQDQFNQGTAIAEVTQSPLNPKVVQEDFMRKWDAKDWFQAQAPQQLGSPEEGEAGKVKGQAQELLSKIGQGQQGARALPRPTVNSMAGQAA